MDTATTVVALLALAASAVAVSETIRHRAEQARRRTATQTLTALAVLDRYAGPIRSAAVTRRLDLEAAIRRHPCTVTAYRPAPRHPAAEPTVLAHLAARRAPAVIRLADRLNDPAR